MRKLTLVPIVLLVGALTTFAQVEARSVDASVSYMSTHANTAPSQCGCFYMNGGAASVTMPHLYRWLGVTAEVGGEHTSNLNSAGDPLSMLTFMAGPRITYSPKKLSLGKDARHPLNTYAQLLLGGVHGFDSRFTSSSGVQSSSSSFAMAAGGGVEIGLGRRWAVRPFQMEYLLTELPNNFTDKQNNMRLSGGVVVHLR